MSSRLSHGLNQRRSNVKILIRTRATTKPLVEANVSHLRHAEIQALVNLTTAAEVMVLRTNLRTNWDSLSKWFQLVHSRAALRLQNDGFEGVDQN